MVDRRKLIAEFEQRLKALSREQRAMFALRLALRVQPLLGYFHEEKSETNPAFGYWREEERAQHLLALFSAIAAAWLRIKRNAISVFVSASASAAAARDAAAAYSYVADVVSATATSAASEAAAAAAYASSSYASSSDAAAYAVYAAYAASASPAYAIVPSLENILKYDILFLRNIHNDELKFSKLWHSGAHELGDNPQPPLEWQERYSSFKKQVLSLHPSFSIWLDFYQDMLDNKAISPEELRIWCDYPTEIEAQGPIAINHYIASQLHKDIATDKGIATLLNRVRAIVLGDGAAGKTSLVRALHGLPVLPDEKMTPGIAINEWDGAGGGLITHIWDFGGQVIAHSTHQFFLRSSCLYILVMCSRSEINANEQAEYWLQHVKTFAEDAPVLMVANKCDATELHLDMGMLKSKYPNIVGLFPLSCLQAEQGEHQGRFADFKQQLRKQLQKVAENGVKFLPPHYQVLQAIRTMSAQQSFLARNEFDKLCVTEDVPEKDGLNRAWLLDILDKLGIIIHFPDLIGDDDYILNPRWLTYGVYSVMFGHDPYINQNKVYERLSREEIRDELGNKLDFPRHKCRVVLDAMQRFKLCYLRPGQTDAYIIPSLLPTDMPAALVTGQNEKKAAAHAYKIEFDSFLPRHVMPELIVVRNREIVGDLVWQNGVVLQDADTGLQAWLQVDYQKRELGVWLFGEQIQEFLASIRRDLREILGRLPGLEWKEKLRLPASARMEDQRGLAMFQNQEDWGSFSQIEANRRLGQTVFISENGNSYHVSALYGIFMPASAANPGNNLHIHNHLHPPAEPKMGQTINITNSTVTGNVTAAKNIDKSFNEGGQNQDLKKELASLLAELQAIRSQIPDKAKHLEYFAEEVKEVQAEVAKSEPFWVKVENKMGSLQTNVTALGGAAHKAQAIVNKVLELLP